MPEIRYLTVQDVLWINHQVVKRSIPFRYADLEEATFYQYGYGSSLDLAAQAGRFVEGFLRKAPFEAGNEQTALLGVETFLRLNGKRLRVPPSEASSWIERIASGAVSGVDAVAQAIEDDPHAGHGEADVEAVAAEVVAEYSGTGVVLSR
jgi:prophage maintenance system killer protein